jgi:hypothetical protein
MTQAAQELAHHALEALTKALHLGLRYTQGCFLCLVD